MKNCNKCKHAEWERTKAGKLHPSGSGLCMYPWKMPPLPASKYFIGGDPKPYGGYVSRKEELKKDCVYFDWRKS
jgi:hypothetical protein